MSACDPNLQRRIQPVFQTRSVMKESPIVARTISALQMEKHLEGGYFKETDRDTFLVPNPFLQGRDGRNANGEDDSTRAASTSIFYLLTPVLSMGAFHRNKARTVHTLHRGRGRYVIIHANEAKKGENARIETFMVGHDIENGERLQWVVEGGKYKASFLLPDKEDGHESNGLLISETVVPGFEYKDHDFLRMENLNQLLTRAQADELQWLVKREA